MSVVLMAKRNVLGRQKSWDVLGETTSFPLPHIHESHCWLSCASLTHARKRKESASSHNGSLGEMAASQRCGELTCPKSVSMSDVSSLLSSWMLGK